MTSLGADARNHLLRLVREGGPGWHAYVIAAADRTEAAEPESHSGLADAIEREIGPAATQSARKTIQWFNGRGKP